MLSSFVASEAPPKAISKGGPWDLKACLVAVAVARKEVSMDEGGRCSKVSVLPVSAAAQHCRGCCTQHGV